ncbi:unnamed protein product, partial [Cladocopium goreaui]
HIVMNFKVGQASSLFWLLHKMNGGVSTIELSLGVHRQREPGGASSRGSGPTEVSPPVPAERPSDPEGDAATAEHIAGKEKVGKARSLIAEAEATQTAQKPDTDAAKDSAVAVELLVGDLVITKSSKKKAKYDNQSGEVISVSKNHIKVLLKTGDSAGEHHRFEKANVVKKENKPVVKRPLQSEVSDADAKRQKAAELFGADKLDDI